MQQGRSAARLRGAFVASASGAMSIAAHGAAGGALPDTPALLMVVLACCAVGAAAAARRAPSTAGLALLLLGGQGLGHLMLSVFADHHQHGGHAAQPGLAMLAAHAAAAGATAALLAAAERLGRAVLRAVARIVVLLSLPVPDLGVPQPPADRWHTRLRQPLLPGGVGTRAPPALAC